MTDRTGTVLMEAVLCLPLLLFLVTGIVQFSRIWEAKLLTRHAAYNAARAALVYNVADYGKTNELRQIEFFERKGVAWAAAANTLAWKSATFDSGGPSHDMAIPGFGGDPHDVVTNSAFIRSTGRVFQGGRWRAGGQVSINRSKSWESNGFVRVTVRFKLPLLFSLFSLGAMRGEDDMEEPYGPDSDDPAPLVHDTALDVKPRTAWDDEIPHFTLEESCVLPKPWSTLWYPRLSSAERAFLEVDPP